MTSLLAINKKVGTGCGLEELELPFRVDECFEDFV